MSNNLQIRSLEVGDLTTNCYLIWCSETLEAIIVDPGDSGTAIIETALQLQIKPVAIVLTHGHFDHVLGLLEVQLAFDIPSYIHQKDNFLLEKAQSSAKYWLKRDVDPVPPANFALDDNQVLQFGLEKLKIVHTPGHTPGSVCIAVGFGSDGSKNTESLNYSDASVLLCGDLIFKDGVGRTDFKYSNTMQLFSSVEKIRNLFSRHTGCYPGHGESFILGERLNDRS